MRIAMMTRWNVPSGQSAHAEPVGRAWLDMGHYLKVLAPGGIDLTLMYQDDEPYVHRCYMMDVWGERARDDYFFDPEPFMSGDYDIFLVEDAELMPMPELLEIFPRIKKKAKTVLVVHEVALPQNPNWYRFDWDAIVCFDRRYKEFLVKAFPADKILIIPFPCLPVRHGDKTEARKQLGLPLDGKIVFAYGYDTIFYHIELSPIIENLSRDYPLVFVLLTHHETDKSAVFRAVPKIFLVREEMPLEERLYSYLHASDAYINFGRVRIDGVGVSSSVATCLGAGCPVLVPGYCNFFDLCGDEVIKYGELDDLEHKLRDIFEGAPHVKRTLAAAERFVEKYSSCRIAEQFIELFDKLNSMTE